MMIKEGTKEAMVGATRGVARKEWKITVEEDKKRAATIKTSTVEMKAEDMDNKVGSTREMVMDSKEEAMVVATRAVAMDSKVEMKAIRDIMVVGDLRRVDTVVETKAMATGKSKADTVTAISPVATAEEAVMDKATAAEVVVTTTMSAIPSATPSSTAAMAMRKAACSDKPCLSLARTSRTSRTKMSTRTRWCRLISRCTARVAAASSTIRALLAQVQPCRR